MDRDEPLTMSEIEYLCDRAGDRMSSRASVYGNERLALIRATLGASNREVRAMARYLIKKDNEEG